MTRVDLRTERAGAAFGDNVSSAFPFVYFKRLYLVFVNKLSVGCLTALSEKLDREHESRDICVPLTPTGKTPPKSP